MQLNKGNIDVNKHKKTYDEKNGTKYHRLHFDVNIQWNYDQTQ